MAESRGEGSALPVNGDNVGLPPRPFLYTIDQLAVLLDVSEKTLNMTHVYFEGRSTGIRRKDMMMARNIAASNQKPDWRVAEREFVRWMRSKGFRMYERIVFTN